MALYEIVERIDAEGATLLVVLDGWIDAGLAAGAVRAQLDVVDELVTVAVFDTDALLDHRARRPTMHLADGVNTGLTWPSIELRAGVSLDGREFFMLVGVEPDHTWRAFSDAVVELADDLGIGAVVGLGAYPAPVPHTRPTGVVGTALDRATAQLLGFVPGRIDVPAGVQAAIEQRAGAAGLQAYGLWAQVPHYAAAMPYPAAALALLHALERKPTQLRFDPGELPELAATPRERLDALVANSDEHVFMVRQLEEQVDAASAAAATDTDEAFTPVSGDELAAELEEFLRGQDG